MGQVRIDYEARFYIALQRICAYMTSAQLQRRSERTYGLDYTEALEMSYDNVREEARAALEGYRRKRTNQPPSRSVAVDPADRSGHEPTPREKEAVSDRALPDRKEPPA